MAARKKYKGDGDRQLRRRTAALSKLAARIRAGGGKAALARHSKRNKLFVRDRIDALLDQASPFLEIGMLAAHGVYHTELPAAGLVAGVGLIQGRWCMVVGNDATVKGGSYYPLTVKKHLRAQEIARRNNLPCVYLVDSGGAYLKGQDEVFPDRDHFGRIFRNQALMSAQGIVQIAVVMGPCTAGGAYIPAMADEVVMVSGNGSIYLAGPPLVKEATGEVASAQELGGADVHGRKSGLVDHIVDSDLDAIGITRRIVANLGPAPAFKRQRPEQPRHDPDGIYGIVGVDLRKAIDMRDLLARITDGSRLDEFKRGYGTTLVTGFAHIDGWHCGVIANNGILFSESALKGAHFIELCCKRGIPLVFLQNITGFMVGTRHEAEGIAKHGAKMVTALSCAAVPKITMIIGNSYGAGNYAMCGRAFDPDFLFTWPSSRIAVMGGGQAAGVMAQITQASNPDTSKRQVGAIKRAVQKQFEEQSDPIYAAARLWDDGVIDPAQSREVLAIALAATSNKPRRETTFGVFRM